MDQRDIDNTLRRHQRRRWLRWLCDCGRRYAACTPRQYALEQRVTQENRPRMDAALRRLREEYERNAAAFPPAERGANRGRRWSA